MTFSKSVREHSPVFPVAWGAPWEAPRALLGPLGPHRAHGGRPPPLGALGAPIGPTCAAGVPKHVAPLWPFQGDASWHRWLHRNLDML